MHATVEATSRQRPARDLGEQAVPVWAPALAITFMGALGHLARSYALPRMSQRFPNTALLAFGLGGQVLLSMVIIAGFTFLGPSGKLLLLVFYPPLFSLLAGFVIRPALRLLLVETRPEVHATLVSLRSAIARAGRGLLHLSEPGTRRAFPSTGSWCSTSP